MGKCSLLSLIIFISPTHDALAYLDPGSGSYLFQLLIAGLTASFFVFCSLKRRITAMIRAFFSRNRGLKDESDQNAG
jgi:hypothetical protein